MSTVNTTSLSDTLPSSIPKLDASGINWAIFSVRLQDAIEAKGFWDHFDGSSTRPVQSYTAVVTAADGTTTGGAEVIPAADLVTSQHQWDKDERSAKSLLTQKIPDSTLMRIHTKRTVVERWNSIVMEYTEKGAYAQTDLRQKFLELKCPAQGNVREFLDNLRVKKEELATVGVIIDDGDYRSTILSSLPTPLANFASMQLAAARMFSSAKTISPDVLISLINEEADRQKVQKSRRHDGLGGKGKPDEKDEALFVGTNFVRGGSDSGRGGSGRGGGRGRRGGWRGRGGSGGHGKPNSSQECWNCGEKGHFKHNCPHPKKETNPPKYTGTANAAAESDSEGDGVWAVESDCDSDGSAPIFEGACGVDIDLDDQMPALEDLVDLDDVEVDVASSFDGASESDGSFFGEEDWFSEPEEVAGELEGLPNKVQEDGGSSSSGQSHDALEEALVAVDPPKPGQYAFVQAELYDSGCTRHISPYREDFESFTDIPPMSFSAANKQRFKASGKGEMVIDVPNGVEVSQLRLTEVLYSPEVGYTLVSIGRLDEKGFTVTFGNGKCVVHGPDDECVGSIPKNKRGLYKVEHELSIEEANAVDETLTLEQLHRRMGHISPVIARKLVENNLVTGVRLETTPSGDPFFCESCVYAKATRKVIPKAREGERADVFAGEVHSDLWGPAPVRD